MADVERKVEVCVIGGGPAGSVAAYHLSQLGHEVLLIDDSRLTKPHQVESFPPSVELIFASLGLDDCLDNATFRTGESTLVRWEKKVPRSDFTLRRLVDRTRFDEALRNAASSVGSQVLGARARSPSRGITGEDWTIPVFSKDGPILVKARFLVDARGRRGGGRFSNDSSLVRTVAMTQSWAVGHDFSSLSRIEAGTCEWFWGSPLPDGGYSATIFFQSDRITGLALEERQLLYRKLLGRTELFRDLLGAHPVALVGLCDATSRINHDMAGTNFVRVGEAAFSIDPLSSQGVQAAIRSAIQGAVAAHTILTRSGNACTVLGFYQSRQQAAAAQSEVDAANLYSLVPNRSSYWRRRSAFAKPRVMPSPQRVPSKTAEPLSLIGSSAFLRLSPGLRLVDVVVLSSKLIKRVSALSHPALMDQLVCQDQLPLVRLIGEVGAGANVTQILQRWQRHVPHLMIEPLLHWLCELGILVVEVNES